MAKPLDHLNLVGYTESRAFKSMLMVQKPRMPMRDRVPHGQRLLLQIENLRRHADDVAARRAALGIEQRLGLTIAIKISPTGIFDYQNLEWKRDGIEVLNVANGEGFDLVVVHVPEGRLAAFEKRIREYLEKTTAKGGPKNATLVNAIESFRSGAFDELWTDAGDPPQDKDKQWFQLWLRVGDKSPAEARGAFAEAAEKFGIELESGYVPFPGRIVVAAYATRAELEQAIELLDMVAEIRAVQPTAEFFLSDLRPADQVQWVRDLEGRLNDGFSEESAYVTLLDTGVAQAHPLIQKSLNPADMHSVNGGWPVTDSHGHGTQMAGMVLHGNLTDPLASTEDYQLRHKLESVRIFPPSGANKPHLYGWITQQSTDIVEAANPERRRSFAMMTTCTGPTTGSPSEWSATIDRLSFGSPGTIDLDKNTELKRRLFVLSCGNIPWPRWHEYPTINTLVGVESPAQAWNALTIGAYTELTQIDAGKWPSLTKIAGDGALSPCSSTSLMWQRSWPFKPDVVAEGGNGSLDGGHPIVGPESLRLLTTHHDMTTALLTETGDTSAAAAEAARLCALIGSHYPSYWPETIRGLIVHGARYTLAMLADLPAQPQTNHKESLVRRFGYGAVRATNALRSTAQRPTMTLQETIVPYRKDKDGIKLNKINMHKLPWPVHELTALGAVPVELRLTLSYFIDPNPSQRGWQSKFRYQSHGLRFAVKAATETDDLFGQRINKIEREEAAGDEPIESMQDPDSQNWFLGSKLRSRGSIHSDIWTGTAAQLASKSHLAVFPVGGWWKDWSQADRHGIPVRYALIVSLEIGEQIDVDLYTPISVQIAVPVPIVVEVPTR